jgi:UDP-N-acetylmuramoyl-L-alanyl-D-glutamate--2,6-diaminopimelate ligase
MNLSSEEISALLGVPVRGGLSVTAATADSRRVMPGSLFVALRGGQSDAHDFSHQAASRGALAIVGEREGLESLAGVPYVRVPHARRALGLLAHRLNGDPSHSMTVIGVTGTNGKSSTVYLTSRILAHGGKRVAHFGTLGYCIGELTIGAEHTTPFAEDLAYMFMQAKRERCTHVAMEVSSHALEQERVAGIEYSVGVFTNLTQDHLDYHRDMEDYLTQKLKLFERIEGSGKFTVANLDDPSGTRFVAASKVQCHTYGRGGECRATKIRVEAQATSFTVETPWGRADISMRLLGTHNVYNALAAITACGGLGVSIDTIAEGVESLASVPGRFEHVDAGQDFQVIVDYAHTEDGLRNVLQAAREICAGRIIVVFGCGGDRDKTKRPKMGATAAELGDFCIVTSDNPRTESPERILLDIEVGLQRSGKKRYDDYIVLADRREAIQRAIEMAHDGDLVMLAGKGHEDYQIVGKEKHHFDDRETARKILEAIRA